jgi:hypothetical protein
MFGNMTSSGLEEAQDRLGGNFGAIESDVYLFTIAAFYAGKSPKGAQFMQLIAKQGDREYREQIYFTNKKGENWFPNKDDKTKKVPLPGFTTVDDICLITTGKPLCEQVTEEKTVKVYDADAKKELPKAVPMLTDVVGQQIKLGVLKQIVNKNVKNESTGEYEATAESREENVTDKVFHPEFNFTVVEAKAEATEPQFLGGWLERNKGKTRDKRSIKEGEAGAAGAPPKAAARAGAAPAPAAGAAPRKSLFGPK